MDHFIDLNNNDSQDNQSNPFNTTNEQQRNMSVSPDLLNMDINSLMSSQSVTWLDPQTSSSDSDDHQYIMQDDYMTNTLESRKSSPLTFMDIDIDLHTKETVSIAAATVANSSVSNNTTQLQPLNMPDLTFTSFHTLVHRRSPFEVSILDPHKSGEGRDAHVTYLIHTVDARNCSEFKVRRRFTDFVWLHDTLVNEFPAVIVCPLPGKHRLEYITGDRFSSDFVDRRRGSLNRFLSRITKHPHLQKSKHLQTFLTETNWNLAQIKSNTANLYSDQSKGPLASAPVSTDLMDTLLPTSLISHKPKNPNPKFTQLKETTNNLETQLSTIDKIHTRLVKRHLELEHDIMEIGLGITKLGALEGNTRMAAVEQIMTQVGSIWMDQAKLQSIATRHDDVDVSAQVRDCLLMCGSVKLALKRRDEKQAEYELAQHALEVHSAELARLSRSYDRDDGPSSTFPAVPHSSSGNNPMVSVGHYIKEKYDEIKGVDLERVRSDRVLKLESKVAKLRSVCHNAQMVDEQFSIEVAREVDYATAARAGDFRTLMLEVVNGHVDFFEKSAKLWESMIVVLEGMDIQVD